MAYSSPTGAIVRDYARLQPAAYGYTLAADLETALTAQVAKGEDKTFARIGSSYETDSSLDARQIRLLQAAVSHRTASVFLWELLVRKDEGTFEPLLQADPADIERLIVLNDDLAEQYEGLLQGAGSSVDTKPFAKPACSSGTFAYTSGVDRTPSQRNLLTDERDDISDQDLETG